MLDKLWTYYHQILFAPEPPTSVGDALKAFIAALLLAILITTGIALIASRIMQRTHRAEVATFMRSRFAWGWAFAVCACLQFFDLAYLWYRDALAGFASAVPLLLNTLGLSCIGLVFYFQLRFELRRSQQVIKRTNEAR